MPGRRDARTAALIAAAAGLPSAGMLALAAHWPLPGLPALAGITLAHLAFAWWRARPAIALAATVLGLGAALAATGMAVTLPSTLLLPYALYRACADGPRLAALALTPAAAIAVSLRLHADPAAVASGALPAPGVLILTLTAVLATACALGLWRRAQRGESEQRAAAAAAAERARVSADMHDLLAHSLAVIVRQADGARYLREPEDTALALAAIATTARDALADSRGVLGVLDPVEPALDALIGSVRAAGLTVEEHVEGEPRTPTLTAYRLVQEALTNVLRHGSGPARLSLTWGADALEVTVVNPAPDRPHTPGRGLRGMRERVTAAGGSVEAGPGPEGFAVRARLPYGGPP